MKHVLSFALILIMSLTLAACTVSPEAAVDPTAAPATEVPATETPATDEPEVTDEPAATDEPEITPEPTPEPTQTPEWPESSELPRIVQNGGTAFLIFPDGTVYGWGRNDHGQLGIGSTEDKRMPVFVSNGMIPVIVGETVFALSADNILWGWGRNDSGQLGLGNTDEALRPVELMHFVKGVYRSYGCVYVLTEVGDLYRLGAGPEAELVFEDVESFFGDCLIKKGGELWIKRPEWEKAADGVVRVFDRGGSFAERSDGMLCYVNHNNELEPICDGVLNVEVADGTAYILKTDGSLWSYARKGDFHEVPEDQLEKLVHIMDGVAEISCGWEMGEDWGYNYNFALKTNGELWSWGVSFSNALVGKAEDNESRDPECVASGVRAFFTNGAQTYAVTYDGRVLATGSGMEHDFMHCPLGDGTEETSYGFVDIGLKDICTVFTHLDVEYIDYDDGTDGVQLYSRTYAVDAEGRIFAWGWNGGGCLGTGSDEEIVLSPAEITIAD